MRQSEDDEDGADVESRDSEVRKAKIQSSVTGKDEKCEKWITEAESVGDEQQADTRLDTDAVGVLFTSCEVQGRIT